MNKTVLIAALAGAISASAVASPQIWFAPNTSAFLANRGDDAKWADARKHIDVYKFYYQQVVQDSPETLKKKIDFLKENNIKIAVEWPALTWQENGPGFKVEGFGPVGMSKLIASKIKSAGGTLDYVAMDEVLFFGHYYGKGKNAPNWTIDQVAQSAASNMKEVWKIFPDAQVGDIEPVDQIRTNRAEMLTQWIQAYKAATGKNLAFLHDDVVWAENWEKTIAVAQEITKKNNIKFGVIYNAGKGDGPDYKWMMTARKNINRYVNSKLAVPDDIVFQSWNKNPTSIYDDKSPQSHSSIIPYFFREIKEYR